METETSPIEAVLAQQPHQIIQRDGVRYTVVGTAHVSRASTEAVRALIADGGFDTIAVELDALRHRNLVRIDSAPEEVDLVRILRDGKAMIFAANLGLAAYQRRLAEQLGVLPGGELKLAAEEATARGLRLWLIDREVGLTFRRAMTSLGFWSRAKLGVGLLASLFDSEDVGETQIEQLKQGDMLESSFGEFAQSSPQLYEALINERDRYMAARLREEAANGPAREVLVVVGAGHLKGMSDSLRNATDAPAAVRAQLESLPNTSRVPWLGIAIGAFVLGSFAWAYWRGGAQLGNTFVIEWVLLTSIGGALGCIAAGGHPLSVLAAAVWSPLKPFHPGVPSGMVSGLVQAWIRKPTVEDFLRLREDVGSLRGWYRNRVGRVLLNFFLTSLGTAIGVITAGARLIGKLG
ncbi:MAG: TraB/GumN family protein [Lysobacteraceae bacterium]